MTNTNNCSIIKTKIVGDMINLNNQNNITPAKEDLNVMKYEENDIKNLIYTIRGKQVMLDSDVANLYHYKTKSLNLAVRRNIERFPEEFCFQLNEKELEDLRFQFETSKREKNIITNSRGGRRYLPYVFTEQGVAMLSGVLKSNVAVDVSIKIIKAFISMRNFLMNSGQIFDRVVGLEYKQLENENRFNKIFNLLQKEEKFKQKIFFQGQIWDSYSLIVDIIKKANSKIIIIDNYVDDSILKMLPKKNNGVEVVILTSDKSNILKLDVQKFNKQYPLLKVSNSNKFHDRFIIIDNKELYHLGASIKDLGNKCFGINKIEDEKIMKSIINY